MQLHTKSFFASMAVADYRWLLANQFAQSAGITAETLATGWLVLQLTDSPFWLGVVVGARGLAQMLFSAVGGTIADRGRLRAVLMRNQLLAAALWTVVLVLAQTRQIAVWHLVLAVAAAGTLHAVNAPTSNALIYAAVGPERLLNANAFGFLARGVFRVAAALAGGYLIAVAGVPATYMLVVVAALVGFVALAPMTRDRERAPQIETPLTALVGGLRYIAHTPHVRRVLLFSLATEILAFPYLHMLPVVARDVLGVGAVGLGYLTAAAGTGQLVATTILAAVGNIRQKERLLLGSAAALGLAIVAFAAMGSFLLALATLLVVGAAAGVYDSTMTTIVQMAVAPQMRGRVLGILVATWGTNQIGAFGVGAVASLYGVPVALAACGALVTVNAIGHAARSMPFTAAREATA